MIEYLWFATKVGAFVALLCIGLAIVSLLSGCAQSRVMSSAEADAYCHRNTAGAALGMNPLGEEYATWMSYCNAAWVQQTLPPLAFGAQTLQTQQAINNAAMAQRTPITCYQSGVFTFCN